RSGTLCPRARSRAHAGGRRRPPPAGRRARRNGSSGDNSSMNPELNPTLRRVASASLLGLILLCVAWETVPAPIRPGGSWLFVQGWPRGFLLRGILRANCYAYQWASMLVLLYLMDGVARVMSDPAPLSVALAGLEAAVSLVFFLAAIFYVRPAKRAARA